MECCVFPKIVSHKPVFFDNAEISLFHLPAANIVIKTAAIMHITPRLQATISIIPVTKRIRDASCPSFTAFEAYTVPTADITRQGRVVKIRHNVPTIIMATAVTSLPVEK